MIIEPTVLVLGAGASVPYGFPTAERLMGDVSRRIREGKDFYVLRTWQTG